MFQARLQTSRCCSEKTAFIERFTFPDLLFISRNNLMDDLVLLSKTEENDIFLLRESVYETLDALGKLLHSRKDSW